MNINCKKNRTTMKILKRIIPETIRKKLTKVRSYLVFMPMCFVCQVLECFARGAPMFKEGQKSVFSTTISKTVLKRFSVDSDEDRGNRYKYSFPYLSKGDKFIDCGCGTGRLQRVLERYVGNIKYLGLDYDKEYVKISKEMGRNTELVDINDLESFENLLKSYQPDVIYTMYSFYFLDEPERFLEIASNYCKYIILGGVNTGRWNHRIRFLFGRTPVTGPPLYHSYWQLGRKNTNGSLFRRLKYSIEEWPRDINKAYPRIWTYKDYVAIFNDLGLDYKLLCYRGYVIGDHYPRMFFGKLRAFGFQFVLSKKKPL